MIGSNRGSRRDTERRCLLYRSGSSAISAGSARKGSRHGAGWWVTRIRGRGGSVSGWRSSSAEACILSIHGFFSVWGSVGWLYVELCIPVRDRSVRDIQCTAEGIQILRYSEKSRAALVSGK